MCCISLQVNPHSPPISPFHIPGLHKLAAVNKMHIKWTLHKMHTTDSTIHTAHTMHTKLLRTHTHTSNAMVLGIAVTYVHILLQMHCFCNSTLYKEMSTCTLHILFNLTLLWKQQTKIEAFYKCVCYLLERDIRSPPMTNVYLTKKSWCLSHLLWG